MAPKRTGSASGSATTLGAQITDLVARMSNVEQWMMDLHPDHCGRVINKMLEIETNTRKLYQGYLQQAQAEAMATEDRLQQLDRDVENRLLALSSELSKEAANHAANAAALRKGMRDLEQSVSDNIGALITGVENRFSNEGESVLNVIRVCADECVDRLHTTAAALSRELSSLVVSSSRSGLGVTAGPSLAAQGVVGEARGRDLHFHVRQGAVIRASSRDSSRESLASHISEAQVVARLRSPRI